MGLKARWHALREEVKELPAKPLAIVAAVIFAEAFGITMIFPYLSALIQDFGYEEEDVGLVAGFVAGSYNAGMFLSAPFWGWASDRFGRKPVLLVCLFTSSACLLAFGFANSLVFAIVTRSLHGLAAGNVAVAKAVLADVSTDKTAARAWSVIGLSYGVGLVIAPGLSGVLVFDKDAFSDDHFLSQFPYFLPPLIGSAVILTASILGIFWLPNTRPKLSGATKEAAEQPSEDSPLLKDEKAASTTSSSAPRKLSLLEKWRQSVWYTLLRDKNVVLATLTYGLLAVATVVFDEIFAIWSPLEHAFGFRPSDVGFFYLSAGAGVVVGQLFMWPQLHKRFGARKAYMLSIGLATVCTAATPFLREIANPVGFWFTLILVSLVRTSFLAASFTACFLLVNNSSTLYAGSANGMAQSFACLLRAVGPIAGPPLFRWSLQNTTWPIDSYFLFLLICIVFAGSIVIAFLLDPSIDYKKVTEEEKVARDEIGFADEVDGGLEEVQQHEESQQGTDGVVIDDFS